VCLEWSIIKFGWDGSLKIKWKILNSIETSDKFFYLKKTKWLWNKWRVIPSCCHKCLPPWCKGSPLLCEGLHCRWCTGKHSPWDLRCSHCCKLCHSRSILAPKVKSSSLSQFGWFLLRQPPLRMPNNFLQDKHASFCLRRIQVSGHKIYLTHRSLQMSQKE